MLRCLSHTYFLRWVKENVRTECPNAYGKGVNPLATISALAERSLVLLSEKLAFSIDMDTRNGDLDADSQPMVSRLHQACPKHVKGIEESAESIGWQFTEVLNGNFCVNPKIKDFVVSENTGKGSSCAMQIYLTIEIFRSLWSGNSKWSERTPLMKTPTDLLTETSRSLYQGKCTGTVSCYPLSTTTLKVIDGDIEFFAQGQENTESKVMTYNLQLQTVEGTQYYLQGHKLICSRISFSPSKTWAATTTLNVIVFQKGGSKVGAGRLRISWQNFRSQLRTFRPTKNFSVDLLSALLAFLVFFVYQVILFFFLPFAPPQRPRPSTRVVTDSWEKLPHLYTVTACDGVRTRLEVYDPLPRPANGYKSSKIKAPPILFLPGVTGVGADYTLYGLPFLRRNMIDYFTALGHRCYILTPRWGCETAVAENCTVYDCRQDIAAALDYICNRALGKPYVVAHCQGSVALAMGLLDGTISGSQVLGVTANSVFMNEVFAYWNSLKGRTTLLIQLYEILAGNFFPIDTSARGDKFHWILDILLRFYPVSDRRELCTSTACHRTSFGFGLLWNHANLDPETHKNIHRFFTGTPTKLLKHVVRGGTHGSCLNNKLQPLMTPRNLERLRGMPILFVSGTENQVFDPESTLKDYELLRRRFGEEYYRRFLVDGYGHLDPIIGKNAAEDVFWKVHEHVKWCFKRIELTDG